MRLQMFPQGGWVGVGLVTATNGAVIGLAGVVHVHVLLPITRVGEPPVAALDLTLERLFACKE